jgi:hypothetical protein
MKIFRGVAQLASVSRHEVSGGSEVRVTFMLGK